MVVFLISAQFAKPAYAGISNEIKKNKQRMMRLHIGASADANKFQIIGMYFSGRDGVISNYLSKGEYLLEAKGINGKVLSKLICDSAHLISQKSGWHLIESSNAADLGGLLSADFLIPQNAIFLDIYKRTKEKTQLISHSTIPDEIIKDAASNVRKTSVVGDFLNFKNELAEKLKKLHDAIEEKNLVVARLIVDQELQQEFSKKVKIQFNQNDLLSIGRGEMLKVNKLASSRIAAAMSDQK